MAKTKTVETKPVVEEKRAPGVPHRNSDWDAALEASYQIEKRQGEKS